MIIASQCNYDAVHDTTNEERRKIFLDSLTRQEPCFNEQKNMVPWLVNTTLCFHLLV